MCTESNSCICLLFLLILTPSSMLPLRRQWLAAFHLSNPSFLSVCHHPPSLIFFIAHRSSLVVVIHPTPGQPSLILPSSRPLSCISLLPPYEAKSLPYLVGLHTFNSGDLSLDRGTSLAEGKFGFYSPKFASPEPAPPEQHPTVSSDEGDLADPGNQLANDSVMECSHNVTCFPSYSPH